ncbi:hypothetical protein GUJ93_ZPchr0007g5465 [Zizania palustris]|uniref:VWFA domain-containing protein n=1 Tax=Zizania palustris TaxID=103762 RepID=A0A8J5T7R6_ZIZPA|nr:hypothetical protein GUJ93_ZPchr0007g5465 [Zizania palustris]
MSYNDDEQTAPTNTTGPARPTGITGQLVKKVVLTKYHNPVASLAPNDQEVMLELKASSSTTDRAGLDFVAVIDVSGSMEGDGINKVKVALLFVIRKLTDLDRLSIVTFSNLATRLCPLRFVTEASQADLMAIVDGFKAYGLTNIRDGLETGLRVVNGRRLTAGRAVNIMLMSDGMQNVGDARAVQTHNVPVHTFGFGQDHDSTVLEAIARNSLGGTFNYVANNVNLTKPFSQLLGGLLTIIAQDLELTVTRIEGEATIKTVEAGTYPQTTTSDRGSVTVRFGTLYSAEVRRIIVYLALDEKTASPPYDANVVMIRYRFTFQDQQVTSNTDLVVIHRTWPYDDAARKPQVETELARRQHADLIRAARAMAEGKNMDNARDKLDEARKALEDKLDQTNPIGDMLREEIRELQRLMEKQNLYNKEGRPYAASSLASHDRQRFTTRGDTDGVRLFATPRMDTYLKQAKQFEENPQEPVPSAAKDVPEPEVTEEPPPPPSPPSAEPEVTHAPEMPRDVAAGDKRKLSVALRVATAVLSLAAFVIIASAGAGAGDPYNSYELYRYAEGVNLVVFIYSTLQAVGEIRRLVWPRSTSRSLSSYGVSLLLDQILAYLLMSASSTAAFGNDGPFNQKIVDGVWLSFLGLLALAANALISMNNLFRRIV